jgi:hypothetical protein
LLFRLSHHFIVGARTFAADMTAAALAGAALSHIFMAIINLIPWRSQDEEAKNDGRQLLGLLCRWQNPDAETLTYQRIRGLMQTRRFEEAADAALSAAKSSVRPISLISMALHCVSRSFGDQAAVNCYLERVDQIEQAITAGDETDLRSFPWLQANVAWSAIKGRCDDLHELIERFSREALEAFPEAPEMKGTRGIWLIESGHHDAGLPLLTEAVRCISDPHDKADFCTFLAQGWKAMGDTVRSEGYQQLREHLIGQQSHIMMFAPISV